MACLEIDKKVLAFYRLRSFNGLQLIVIEFLF